MARLNIEACWWSDPRRAALIRMGLDAEGVATRAWKLAQEFWKTGRGLVPLYLFQTLQEHEALVKVCLAEVRGEQVYIRGSSAYLDWLIEASLGGKSSAKRPRDAKGRLLPKGENSPSPGQVLSKGSPRVVQDHPSSVSVSVSVSKKNTEEEESKGQASLAITGKDLEKSTGGKFSDDTRAKASVFAAAYVKSYQTKFPGGRPEDLNDSKTRGQIMLWLKDYNLDRAVQLIQVYFQMDAKWFDTKGYDFITFRNNLQKIGQALQSGVDPDGKALDRERLRIEVGA